MEDLKPESVDFVKEFQEYLTQQTQHVNMISGSVCGENNQGDSFQAVTTASDQGGLDPPSVEVSLSLDDGAELQMDGLERTPDGKYKCSYCNYVNKGMARLIEHIRIHTGEKPHRCQLCPFASAYERHLEAHMRSHTGEKPYKCDLCAFCCSDRSNLSHHRRRRHKLLPMRGVRSPFTNKRMLSVLQKRATSLGFGRRLLGNYSGPPSLLGPRADYSGGLAHDATRPHLSIGVSGEYKTTPVVKPHESGSNGGGGGGGSGGGRGANGLPSADSPLDQLSTLAGQLATLPQRPQSPRSLDRLSCEDDVKPILVQQASGPPLAVAVNGSQTARSPKEEDSDPAGCRGHGPGGGGGRRGRGAGSTTAAAAASARSSVSPAWRRRPPPPARPRIRRPRTSANTVTSSSRITSCTPYTWVAMATSTPSSATSAAPCAGTSTTLPATTRADITTSDGAGWGRRLIMRNPVLKPFNFHQLPFVSFVNVTPSVELYWRFCVIFGLHSPFIDFYPYLFSMRFGLSRMSNSTFFTPEHKGSFVDVSTCCCGNSYRKLMYLKCGLPAL